MSGLPDSAMFFAGGIPLSLQGSFLFSAGYKRGGLQIPLQIGLSRRFLSTKGLRVVHSLTVSYGQLPRKQIANSLNK